MSRKILIFLCLFAFYVPFTSRLAQAADPSEQRLSLQEALTTAYEQNPLMLQTRMAIESAEGDSITASTWADPQLEAEIGGFRESGDGERRGHLDSISFQQPFDPPGVRSLKRAISRNNTEIEEESVRAAWSEVYAEVRTLYARLILHKKELELKQSNLQSMRQFFSDVQVRYQSGQTLKNHVQRARIELLKAESDYLEVENKRDIDKARMNLLLGRSRDVPFDVKDNLTEERLTLDLAALTEMALISRPDLNIEKTTLDSKTKTVKMKRLSRLPSYSLGVQMTDEEHEKDYAAVVEISLPLWNFNRGGIKKSRAEQDAQAARLEQLRNEITFEVYVAYKDADLASKQLALHKQSRAEANEMFRLAGLSYGEGHIDFLDYLDQLQASLDSRMRYYKGLYRLNQSINALEAAIHGSLREETYLQ